MFTGSQPYTATSPSPTPLPAKRPIEDATWAFTIAGYVPATETVAQISASVAPSGSGEMTITTISLIGQTIGLTLTGGQPTRVYTVQCTVTMTDGSVYQPLAQVACQAVLWTDTPQVAPVPGFGTPIIWSGGVVSYTTGLVGAAFLTAAGTNQATAAQIGSVSTVVNAGTGGVILPAISGLIYGTLPITNPMTVDVLLYPAVGDAFLGLSVNEAVTLSAGASLNVVLVQGATSWVLGS